MVGLPPTPGPLLPIPQGVAPVDTLDLANNTLLQGNFRAPHGTSPDGAVNDTINGDLYVADNGAISVLDPNTQRIITTISVPGAPQAMAFDPANGAIYAANVDTNHLVVVNGSTNTVVANVAVGSLPVAVALDPVNGNVYVACAWSNSVSVVSTSNNTLIANLSVGLFPGHLAVDTYNGAVFVANSGGSNLSVISATNETVFANVSLGAAPGDVLYDGATGDVYVPLGSTVDVVNGTNDTVVGKFATGSGPKMPVIDPANGDLYIPCYGSSNFTVYSPTSGKVVRSIALFTRPIAVAFAPVNQDLYVTEQPPAILPIRFQVVSTVRSVVVANISGGEYLFSVFVGGTSGTVFAADYGYNDIEVVSPRSNTVVNVLPISVSPVQVTADPAGGQLFVGDAVTSAVWAISEGSGRVVHTWNFGTGPSEIAYDPVSQDVYVAAYGSHSVTVLSGRNDSVVATLQTGGGPEALAVDPVNDCIYVANVNSANLTVINATTNRVTATVGFGINAYPWMLAADSKSGDVYVFTGGELSVVSGKTQTVVANISLTPSSTAIYSGGDPPLGVTYDPTSNDVYVATFWTNQLFVVSAANNSLVATDATGSSPQWASVSSNGEFVYVSNGGSGNVTIVNATSNTVVGSIPVGNNPGPVFDDAARGELVVANQNSGNLTLVNSSSHAVVGSVLVGNGSNSFAMDTSTGNLWIANGAQGTLSILAPPTYSVEFNESGLAAGGRWSVTLEGLTESSNQSVVRFNVPNGSNYAFTITGLAGYTWTPQMGSFNMSGHNLTLNVTFVSAPDRFLVSFDEVGLPLGAVWGAALNGTSSLSTTGISLSFSLRNATGYTFQVVAGTGFVATPANGTFAVGGAPVTINVSFAASYVASFTETGLPTGQHWTVALNGTSVTTGNTTLAFLEPNGTYAWSVTPIAGYTTKWSGTLEVSDANSTTRLLFVQETYLVKFSESGLPFGTLWNLSVGTNTTGSRTATITAAEPNGTYTWSVVPIPGYTTNWSGSLVVAGLPALVNITFSRVNYTLVFAEGGLPQGTTWAVTIGTTRLASTTPYIDFVEPNGTYAWSIAGVPGYSTIWSGVTTMQGADRQANVSFTAVDYPVTFREVGLSGGTAWNVSLNGMNLSSTTSTIVFSAPNGTYGWVVGRIPDVVTAQWNGSVNVDDGGVTVSIVFTGLFSQTFVESGLPTGAAWWVNLSGVPGARSTTPLLAFDLPNGTYGFSVATVPKTYAGSGGTFTVSGADQQVPIVFTLVSFQVRFGETGLPLGTRWWLNLSGESPLTGTGSTLTIALPNGTYAYSVASSDRTYDAAGGSVQVAGTSLSPLVTFSEVTFDVVFQETGLAPGTNWSVALGGVTHEGSGALTFTGLPNGTYRYSVGPVTGYVAAENTSSITVSGSSPAVTIAFSPIPPTPSSTSSLSAPWMEYAVVAGVLAATLAIGAYLARRRHREGRRGEEPPSEGESADTGT